MKLGAQLFSLRTHIQTPEDIRTTFQRLRDIGYETVQFSGASTHNAAYLREVSQEMGLPIVCTHVSMERLTEETDAVIREHLTMGCPTVGLGAMPNPYRGSAEGLQRFLKDVEGPVARIMDAGLHFAYHNHDFEFEKLAPDQNYFDYFIENCPDWQLILDTYWVTFAGHSAVDYLKRISPERLVNVHFKDMARDEKRSICACGEGQMNFAELAKVCREIGVVNILAEQDNAVEFPDAFEQMAISYRSLRPIV